MEPTLDLASLGYNELLALVRKAGGITALAHQHGMKRTTLRDRLKRLKQDPFSHRPAPEASIETVTTGVRRFILTSAQDSTKVHEGFLANLETYRDWLAHEGPCEIIVAGFTYNKSLFEDHSKNNKTFFHSRVKPYMRHERIQLGDRVVFCGEMNTLPTADMPLSGFETYTREHWGIFPHAKVQLKSIPRMKGEPPKMIMTTGAVTRPNYVQKKAGIKASFHHIFGAVLVEIAADGKFFCRHLLGDDDGSFYDLDRFIADGTVEQDQRVEAITWGDIHVAQIDPVVAEACWGFHPEKGRLADGTRPWTHSARPTMIDTLRPRYQFYHDTFDGKARNSHSIKDHHHMFSLYVEGSESMENEGRETAMFLTQTRREWCKSIAVASNHDAQIERWLKTPDHYANDPINAVFFLRCQLAKYEALERRDGNFSIFEYLMKHAFDPWTCGDVRFLREDESFIVKDIEQGNHGHLGANGARGSASTFRRMGRKSTAGHVHGPYITDGSMGAGVCQLEMGYNKGLSNWAIAHVVTLPNGKRQLVVMHEDGEWRL